MLSAICLVFTLCDISTSSLCIRTTDIQTNSIFFRQLVYMLCLQYLFALVSRSEVRSTERSIIVSLSLGKYHAGFLKGISPNCPFLSLPECEIQAELCGRVTEGGYCVSAWESVLICGRIRNTCNPWWMQALYMIKPGVHKISTNLGAFLKTVGARRVTWSNFHTEAPSDIRY